MTVVSIPCTGLVPDATITTVLNTFSPSTTTIPVGGTLKFTPTGFHDMTSDTGDFATPTNQEACLQFTAAGTFPYHCSIHPFMTGTVTVQ